ncbi:MAG: hypothetical protein FD170_63 [Bacteroidetes bacterium]|nr:MAG: hypothetical protein FD170_63 [Bacteroidota bacterium]
MKNIFIFTFLALFSTITFAQKSQIKFGKIDNELLALKTYDADTSSGALIISDIGDISIIYNDLTGFSVIHTRHLRVKIFNSSEFDVAKFKIKYHKYGTTEQKITKLRASSFHLDENNKVVRTDLDKDNIFTEHISSKEKSKNFSIPNIKEGSVFDLEYSITSELFGLLPEWNFQHHIPALISELSVSIPEYFNYKRLLKGYLTPTATDSKTTNRSIIWVGSQGTSSVNYTEYNTKYTFLNVPALKEEAYMNDISNYIAAIEYELGSIAFPQNYKDFTTNWVKIGDDLWFDEDFGAPLKRSGPLKKEAEALRIAYPDPFERMVKAHEFIRNSVNYSGANGIYLSESLRKVWDEKKGKSSDINLLLISLLNECDIKTSPVILSTRSNGMLHPGQLMINKFNYVIAEAIIDSNTYLLDATDKNLSYNMLPIRCLNGNGRRISRESSENDWVNLNTPQEDSRTYYNKVTLDASGNLSGDFSIMETRYFAHNRAIDIREKNNEEEYINEFEAEIPGLQIGDYTIENLNDRTNPLYLKFKAEIKTNPENNTKDIIYLSPTLGMGISSNPFVTEERVYPIDFINPWVTKNICIIDLPEGYEVVEMPKNISLSLSNNKGIFKYIAVVNGNQLQFQSVLTIKTPLITFQDYGEIRELYTQIVSKNAEMVVLKKL